MISISTKVQPRMHCGTTIKALTSIYSKSRPPFPFFPKTHMDSPPKTLISQINLSRSSTHTSPKQYETGGIIKPTVSIQEWQAWGTDSPLPSTVSDIVEELKLLESQSNDQMSFGGLGGKIKGELKVQEDKKHRARYKSLSDSEEKLQFFSARQVACRLLGSIGYLCQKCWLPAEDCMCSKLMRGSLWHGIRFWLYMHPKDFLRQNNTGKLLWQVFGVESASLCLYGVAEHEEFMWNAFIKSGKNNVWCLYPNKNAPAVSIQDCFFSDSSKDSKSPSNTINADEKMNFVLLDGTWNNSAAMFRRLKERANLVWGNDIPCLSLTTGASAMHRLRPQPSWDRTCTAGAAVGLLDELHVIQDFKGLGLDKQAEAIEAALELLLEALTSRRLRMGRSIDRRARHNDDIC